MRAYWCRASGVVGVEEDDIILKIAVESINSYSEFVMNKLAAIPGIQNFKSHIVLSTMKNSTRFPIKLRDG